ncbi:hypothetical protein TNCV_4896421 [Trichonephila clavipes]|uniref:Uncharacterized protein n=1 Tax=Trichonephila clavipes TaxID=2585209 RepID=A0A8X6VX20_TRICX|nr:hypothetical protein TNCV_4896421 [Trichonephila clavipes]
MPSGHECEIVASVVESWVLTLVQLKTCHVQGLLHVKSVQAQSPPVGGVSTRGLLATDHVILNHGQETWTTPELALETSLYSHLEDPCFEMVVHEYRCLFCDFRRLEEEGSIEEYLL